MALVAEVLLVTAKLQLLARIVASTRGPPLPLRLPGAGITSVSILGFPVCTENTLLTEPPLHPQDFPWKLYCHLDLWAPEQWLANLQMF